MPGPATVLDRVATHAEDGSSRGRQPPAVAVGVDLRHRLYHSDGLQQLADDAAVGAGLRLRAAGPRPPPRADAKPSQPAPRSAAAARVGPEVVARARANRRSIVDEFDLRFVGAVQPLKQGGGGPRLGRDDVAVEVDGRLGRGQRLQLVLSFILGVHREEPEHEQVHGGTQDGQTEQDEDKAEDEVLGSAVHVFAALERHVVAEAYRGQRDDAVVDGVEVRPALVAAEHPRTASNNHARHVHTDDDQTCLRYLSHHRSGVKLLLNGRGSPTYRMA